MAPPTKSSEPVPPDLAQVLEPGWLADALDDVRPDERIVAVEQVDASRTLASKVRIAVVVQGVDGTLRSRRYCIKAHFGGGPETLATEARVYRDLSPVVGVRTPRAYYSHVDEASGRGVIVMDDVLGQGGRFLGAAEPYSLATCRDTLGQLAVLHARTWHDARWDVDWLAPRITHTASMYATDVLQGLLDDGRGPDLPAHLRDAATLQAAIAKTAETPATCVLHGDTHSGNAYLDADGRACWLDWQITQRGHWSTDVSYHLGTVLTVEARRAHEVELLQHYLGTLAANGVEPPPWDEAWHRYTLGFTWGYFLWTITRISSREVVLLHVPRLGAALADHDTFERLGVT